MLVNGYTVYKYTVGDKLTVTDGAYDDNVLNAYQYFVAPLLLRDNYISYDSIWVTQAGSFLSIRLYATDSDSGKSTVTPGEHDVLIAEARVYEGLSFEPETKWYLKGDFNSWGETDRMVYTFDAYNPEQYSISKAVTAGQKFKLYSSAGWKGYSDIQTNAEKWFNDDNDDIVSKINGTITIYWKPGENKMWIEVPGTSTAEYTMTVTNDWDIFSNSAVFYLWVWGNGYGSGDWVTVTNPSGKTFKATIRIEATNFELVRMDPGKTCPSWDAKWNSGQTALTAGTLLYDITF